MQSVMSGSRCNCKTDNDMSAYKQSQVQIQSPSFLVAYVIILPS